jgi:hypothetical protein
VVAKWSRDSRESDRGEGRWAIGDGILAIGDWILAMGYWILAIGDWLLDIGDIIQQHLRSHNATRAEEG